MNKRINDDRSLGAEIITGLKEALAYERGELANVKVTRVTREIKNGRT